MSDETRSPGEPEPDESFEAPSEEPERKIDPEHFERFLQDLRVEQNFTLGVVAGSVAALVGAVLWAVITVVTEYQIGWMAVGVGLLVGLAIRYVGKGVDKFFGAAGAALALLGCLLGNLLAGTAIVAAHEGVSFWTIFGQLNFGFALSLLSAMFSPIDLLFYGIAVYEGYQLSFRQLSEDQIARLLED